MSNYEEEDVIKCQEQIKNLSQKELEIYRNAANLLSKGRTVFGISIIVTTMLIPNPVTIILGAVLVYHLAQCGAAADCVYSLAKIRLAEISKND